MLVNATQGRYHSVPAEPNAEAPVKFQAIPKVTLPGSAGMCC